MSFNGFDFSDGAQFPPDENPDMKYPADAPKPAHLQRNKTERGRLQGLQQFNTAVPMTTTIYEPKTFWEKWDRWMINEGGKRLFFSAWILLHLLVAVFGFLNYELKDNLTTARATFGITFGTLSVA
jgi:NADPH oxidase